MKRRNIKEIGASFRGMYIRNIADIPPKWKGIRNADIMPNWSDICSTADIPKLCEIMEERAMRTINRGRVSEKNSFEQNKSIKSYNSINNRR